MASKHYTVGGADGWLNIKSEPSGKIIAVSEYLQVDLTSTKDGRDFFTILEGFARGKKFSVKSGNLRKNSPGYHGPAQLTFSLSNKRLSYPGGQVKAITHNGSQPIPAGMHPIQIPDFPHALGTFYVGQSPYAKTWFFLGQGNAIPGNNDRYLHTGEVSNGCITVDPAGWTQLYQYLILCRSNDEKTVGMVTVIR